MDFGGIYLYFISEGCINIFKELFVCVQVMNIFRAEWEFRDGWIYLLLYDSNHVKTVQPAWVNIIYRFMWSTRIGHQQGMGFAGVGKKILRIKPRTSCISNKSLFYLKFNDENPREKDPLFQKWQRVKVTLVRLLCKWCLWIRTWFLP